MPVVYANVPGWFFEDFSGFLLDPVRDKRTFVMAADRPMNFIAAQDIGCCVAELLLNASLTAIDETIHVEKGIDDLLMSSKIPEIMTQAWGVPSATTAATKRFSANSDPDCESTTAATTPPSTS